MPVLLTGVGLLALAFLLQIALWRIALPKQHTRALLILFAVLPFLVFGVAAATGHRFEFSIAEIARLGLLYGSCALAYIVLYSAIEMQSPTLTIVSHLASAGAAGCSGPELFDLFGREGPLASRIPLMEQGGWLKRDGDILTLTSQGLFYARLFDRGSTIVGLGQAKGG